MDKIRESTESIYIHFWNKYDKLIDEKKATDKYQHIFRMVLDGADNSNLIKDKNELVQLFSLYFYIIDNVDMVYKNRCESSDEILSILSIYSLVCKELDYLFRLQLNLDNVLVTQINHEMINSMCIINNLKDKDISKLLGDSDDSEDTCISNDSEDTCISNDSEAHDVHSSHINSAKERLFKLYLKLISII